MKYKYLIPFCLVTGSLFFACNQEPEHLAPSEISMVIGDPVDYGSDDYLLFPVGGNYNPKITEPEKEPEKKNVISSNSDLDYSTSGSFTLQLRDETYNNSYMTDRKAKYEFGNSDETNFDIRNLLFYNKKTGQSYPLVKDTVHILSFAFHYEFKKPLVFYRVVKKDINGDKKYNSEDAVMLYMSDTMGQNFTKITPENEQLLTYFHYPETNTLLVKTAMDIDKDGEFTAKDETTFREVHLDKPGLGRPIFSDSLKATLKKLMY